jgi:TusA-related sulfurtransferase
MLAHMPAFALTDLKPGEALIVVSTQGANSSEVTAIVMLTGVEPILQARPKGSNQVVLPAWNITGGGGEGEGGP